MAILVKTEVKIQCLKSKNPKMWTAIDNKITRATTHPSTHNSTTANKYLLTVFPPPTTSFENPKSKIKFPKPKFFLINQKPFFDEFHPWRFSILGLHLIAV